MSAHDNLGPQFHPAEQFGDGQYTFEHTHSRAFGVHILRADHPDTPRGKASAGHLRWHDDGEIANVSVLPEFRRQGLATEMLRKAKEISPNIHHSTNLIEDGPAWAKANPL